ADPTATELRLDPPSSRTVVALLSGLLAPFPTITSPNPSVDVLVGTLGPRTAQLGGVATTVGQARALLETAIRAADPAPEFADAIVVELGDQLLMLPGGERAGIVFVPRLQDSTTVLELKLESARPAVAATAGGEGAGPDSTFVRSTFFGAVHVRELALAS